MNLRQFCLFILLFTVIIALRPALACAITDAQLNSSAQAESSMTALESAKALPTLSVDSESRGFETDPTAENSVPEESNDDNGQADIGLDEIASLAYEFHFYLDTYRDFSRSDEYANSVLPEPILQPPSLT